MLVGCELIWFYVRMITWLRPWIHFPSLSPTTGWKSSRLSEGVRAGQACMILALVTVSQLPAIFSFGFLGPVVGFLCSNPQCLSYPPLEPMETFCIHSVLYQGVSWIFCSLPGRPTSFFSSLNLAPTSCCLRLLILVLEHRESRQFLSIPCPLWRRSLGTHNLFIPGVIAPTWALSSLSSPRGIHVYPRIAVVLLLCLVGWVGWLLFKEQSQEKKMQH